MINSITLESNSANSNDNVIGQDNPAVQNQQVPDETKKPAGLIQLMRQYASLSDLLRYAGVVAVSVAMALFLIDGAVGLTYLQRFLTMLGFSGLLTAAGFIMSMLLKEQRGSRAFMMLSLLSVPVNFTVFGALFYSFAPLDRLTGNYPGFALWQAEPTDVVTALVAGISVLIPVTWIGFSVLARNARQWLTVSLLSVSAVLVVPVRQEFVVVSLALVAGCALWFLVKKYCSDKLIFKTTEGKFSIAVLALPVIILLFRSVVLYDAGSLVSLLLSGGFYLLMRRLLLALQKPGFMAMAATLITSIAALATGIASAAFIHNLTDIDFLIPMAVLIYPAMSHDLIRVSPSARAASMLGIASAVLSVLMLLVIAFFGSSLSLSITCVMALIAIAACGYTVQSRPATVIALVGILVIAARHIDSMWDAAMQTGWWGIAAAGAIAIVSGSLVDRAGTVVVDLPTEDK